MSKISRRFLDNDLQLQLTGMQSDVIGLTGAVKILKTDGVGYTGSIAALQTNVAGLTGSVATLQTNVAGLTGAVKNLETNVLGLTGRTTALETGMRSLELGLTGTNVAVTGNSGAILNLQTYVAGLTGRTAALELGLTDTNVTVTGQAGAIQNLQAYVLGLTGSIASFKSYTGAYLVGFSPITGIGDTNVQGAILSLKAYVDSGITGVGLVTGLQGATGIGMYGATGAQGVTGVQSFGFTGLQGVTGPQIIMDTMLVEKIVGITGISFTGAQALSYSPITGFNNNIIIPRSGQILTLMSLKYKHITSGSVTVGYMLQRDGVTGMQFNDYLSDNRERDKTFYDISPVISAGSHTYQLYWKLDYNNKLIELDDSSISNILLEGSIGITGLKGTTGVIGVPGATGAFGGPPGETGIQGPTGIYGPAGVTGPGVASFSKFVKILPMEEWKSTNLTQDIHGDVPVLEFESMSPIERMEMALPVPLEWDGSSNMTLRIGTIIDAPVSTGNVLSFKLSYKGFSKTGNTASFAPYYTDTQTITLSSPSQYDFHELAFTLIGTNLQGYDYLFLRIDKVTGSPNQQRVGICSTQLEHGVSVGMGPTGYQGCTGVPGVTGFIGATGISAETGPKGCTGSQGYTGAQGITGIVGVTGFKGDTGSQGETGSKGDTGVIGIQGPTGAFGGPPGETGLQGLTGFKGETGSQGYTGIQGLTGIAGITGTSMGDTGIYSVNFYSDAYLSTNISQSISLDKPIQINQWRIFAYETGAAQVRLDVGQYPPSFQMDAGATGPYLILDGVRTSTDFSNWAGTTGAYDDLLRVSFVGVTGIKSLGVNLYYNKV